MTGRVASLHIWPATEESPVFVERLVLDFGGPIGDRQYGMTMTSDVRQRWLYPAGTEIRNNRQVSFPCTIAGGLVASRYGTAAEKFPKAAIRHRGVTGWVERPGTVEPGMSVRVLTARPSG